MDHPKNTKFPQFSFHSFSHLGLLKFSSSVSFFLPFSILQTHLNFKLVDYSSRFFIFAFFFHFWFNINFPLNWIYHAHVFQKYKIFFIIIRRKWNLSFFCWLKQQWESEREKKRSKLLLYWIRYKIFYSVRFENRFKRKV